MRKIWVLVADEAIARILQWPEEGNKLEPVEELTDPDAHAEGTDLRRDAEGRRSGSAPHNPHTPHRLRNTATVTASAGEGEQHLEAEGFARRVAQHLGESLERNRFEELRISAAPRFLGMLRKFLPPQVSALVTEEQNKDLIHMSNEEITRRFFPDGTPARPRPA